MATPPVSAKMLPRNDLAQIAGEKIAARKTQYLENLQQVALNDTPAAVAEAQATADEALTLAETKGPPVEILDEGASLTAHATSINFEGPGVTATVSGDAVTVTIPGSSNVPMWMAMDGEDGEDGWSGAPGPAGPSGGAGPAGSTGPAGPPGVAGQDGDSGEPGPPGPAGATGATGPAGPQGAIGIPGLDGEEGPQGFPLVGPAGPAGAAGPTGPTGPTGTGGGQHEYEGFNALPLAATFTAVNQSTSTLTDSTTSLFLTWTNRSGSVVEAYVKSTPGGTYDVYCRIPALMATNGAQVGITLRNSSTGKLITWQVGDGSNAPLLLLQEWTTASTFSSTIVTLFPIDSPNWLRLHSDGTTITAYAGTDGLNWVSLATRTIATFLGSVDQMGVSCCPAGSGAGFIGNFSTGAPT